MVSHLTSPLCAAQTWTSTLSCRGYSSLWQHSDWQQQMRYTDLANFMYQSVFPSVMFFKKNHKTTWASFLINDLGFSFLSDKTCQWHFQYDCAQAKKTVCKLWEGEGTLCQVFWTVVRVWPGGVRGAPHLPDVSLPARTYKLIPQTHVTEGLHHCTARYFCGQRKLAPPPCLPESCSTWLPVTLASPTDEVSSRVSLQNRW